MGGRAVGSSPSEGTAGVEPSSEAPRVKLLSPLPGQGGWSRTVSTSPKPPCFREEKEKSLRERCPEAWLLSPPSISLAKRWDVSEKPASVCRPGGPDCFPLHEDPGP